MTDQKNMLLAIVLSAIVLIAWQYFVGMPQMERQREEALLRKQQEQQQQQVKVDPAPSAQQQGKSDAAAPPQAPAQPGAVPSAEPSRAASVQAVPRVQIDTPRVRGSISLRGARIDDLALVEFRQTVDPKSPPIVLLSPSGGQNPFYAEFGWVGSAGTALSLPDRNTVWKQEGSGSLGLNQPVTLVHDNGQGLIFRRIIRVDDHYLFTVEDRVENKGEAQVALHPYGLISRHGRPQIQGFFILHEGLVGVIGDEGLQEVSYADIEERKAINFNSANSWFGITDKYWAATLLPDPKAELQIRFSSGRLGDRPTYQTDYLGALQTLPPGGSISTTTNLFAGAKEVAIVDGYDRALNLNRFELLIDWGWFYFITKPMFQALHFFYVWLGNFGLAILLVTVIIKLVFFPLASKAYASMAKMKAVQPEMMAIRERYADDRTKQQQALMDLYKKQQINPLAGCLPIVIQIPVFFALYKVLFISIEMRHAPFFGWIKDLSAPDPTSIFNLFGLIPWDPSVVPVIGPFLMLGVWPIIMGITMWFQLKLNPQPPDPMQKMIFDWMPVFFTFLLASFSAGLVIYWAWNNFLSVLQQSFIMHRNGAKIELFDNIRGTFNKKKKAEES